MKIHNYGNDYAFRRKLQDGTVDEKKVKKEKKTATKVKQYDNNPIAGAKVLELPDKIKQADTQEPTADQGPKKEKAQKPQK